MNCIIVHGSNQRDEEKLKEGVPPQDKRNWLPWIKEKLEEEKIETFTPLMPNNSNPLYEEWKEEFEKLPFKEETVLIGHSAGGAFLVRYLGETRKRAMKFILVAPAKFFRGSNKKMDEFYNFEVDKTIKERIKEIVIFTSNNDSPSICKSVKLYHGGLGGKLVELKDRGHFILSHMGTNEFPELLKEVLK